MAHHMCYNAAERCCLECLPQEMLYLWLQHKALLLSPETAAHTIGWGSQLSLTPGSPKPGRGDSTWLPNCDMQAFLTRAAVICVSCDLYMRLGKFSLACVQQELPVHF